VKCTFVQCCGRDERGQEEKNDGGIGVGDGDTRAESKAAPDWLRDDKESLHGKFVQLFDPIPGWHLRRSALRRRGVRIVPRAVDVVGQRVSFADRTSEEFDAVVWAIGYQDDPSWIRIPGALAANGSYVHDRGVSPVPGLFHIGREWQNNRASALLTGVGNDAREIAAKAVAFVRSAGASRACP
jgi:putative flavoprotein involved in K+ transport